VTFAKDFGQRIFPPESSNKSEMKLRGTWMTLLMACFWPAAAFAQLQLVPDKEPQSVFAGDARTVTVVWHNAGDNTVDAEIRARILQTSSATAILRSDNPWKRLSVPADETILESAQLNFPTVKAETKFLVQWLENSNSIIGKTEVLVYPTNLLADLKPLADDEALGVLDPLNQLKPLLKNLKLTFTDLENFDLEDFSGRLAIIGPFQSQAKMRDGLADQIKALAKKGAAVVWIQPPSAHTGKLQPSFYTVWVNTNVVAVVQPELVANLPENPQSQLNLIYLCKLALNPQPPALPSLPPSLEISKDLQ
jgi:hypothetical protein